MQQEEIHALGAVSILKSVGAFAPSACQYQFPVADLKSSVMIAETFTAAVLGALQGANVLFAMDQEPAPIQLISSVIGQEGEQTGFFRVLLQEVSSESPFLTTVPAPFAWSALQMFVVPGSCPYPLSNINLPILPGIMVNGGPIAMLQPQDQTLSFSADLTASPNAQKYIGGDGSGLYMTYQTGQLTPISMPISDVQFNGNVIGFKADFPFTENVMSGFSHGALTMGNQFVDANAAAEAALAAPALIQVKNGLATDLLAKYGVKQSSESTGGGDGSCAAAVMVGGDNVIENC